MPIFLVDVLQDLVYAFGLPSRPVRPILNVKRALKLAYASFRQFSCAIVNHFLGDPDSDVKNAKFFRGHPSRPCLCIRFTITASPTHLECQTSPEASIPLISTIFVCYSKPFLDDSDSDVKMTKFLVDVHQDLVYASGCPSRTVRPILKVKRAPKRTYPSFR